MPPLPLAGGCLCGAIRYELRAAPLAAWTCHCTDCQRQSGSAFGMTMIVPRDGVVVTAGEPASWERTLASGASSALRFCATCATRLWSERPDLPIASIRPGTLDDTRWLKPMMHLWTQSAQGWISFSDGAPAHDTQSPAAFSAALAAWARENADGTTSPA